MTRPTMTAIRFHETGGPEVLRLDEVPRPDPGPGEVLVQVHAAGVNPPDWYAREGFATIPPELRPQVRVPFIPGTDVSGVVVSRGPGTTDWAVGDPVIGLLRFPTGPGAAKAYAQYATAPVSDLARAPAHLDHVHAAGVPMAGLTAYQFVFDHAQVRAGTTVLVNGAAGGVGHFLVQLAKAAGARVIGIASTRHDSFLRGLGVDQFVDYTAIGSDSDVASVAGVAREVDYVFDTVGGPHGYRLLPALKDGGRVLPVFFGDYRVDEAAQRGITVGGGQVRSEGQQLTSLVRMIDTGAVRVHLDSVFPLADARRAHEHAQRGHLQGKIVLRVDHA